MKAAVGSLSFDQLVVACKNIGYDLTCGECASVFYTGIGGYPHTCSATPGTDKPKVSDDRERVINGLRADVGNCASRIAQLTRERDEARKHLSEAHHNVDVMSEQLAQRDRRIAELTEKYDREFKRAESAFEREHAKDRRIAELEAAAQRFLLYMSTEYTPAEEREAVDAMRAALSPTAQPATQCQAPSKIVAGVKCLNWLPCEQHPAQPATATKLQCEARDEHGGQCMFMQHDERIQHQFPFTAAPPSPAAREATKMCGDCWKPLEECECKVAVPQYRLIGSSPIPRDGNSSSREAVKPSGRRHELKTWPAYFEAIERGDKKFELRENDRNFRVGDLLILREWDPRTGDYTGRESRQWVTYVIDDVFATVTKFGPSPHDRLAVLSIEGAVVLDPLGSRE